MDRMSGRLHRIATLAAAAISVGALVAACGGDDASPSHILVVTPDAAAVGSPTAPHEAAVSCGVLPDPPGPSGTSVSLRGFCALDERNQVTCEEKQDDFFLYLHRGVTGGSLDITVNVEHYTGPGDYPQDMQVFIQLQQGGRYVNWQNNAASGSVGAEARSADLATTTAPPVAQGGLVDAPETIGGHLACAAAA